MVVMVSKWDNGQKMAWHMARAQYMLALFPFPNYQLQELANSWGYLQACVWRESQWVE